MDISIAVRGNENADLGRLAESMTITNRDPANDVRRDVVERDPQQRRPSEQVEPEIATMRTGAGGEG
jgi:hypothetical protein